LDLDTTIIGAGPYGLSIAAHLRAARLPFTLLGTPLESWRSFMPAGMLLKSEPFASNLWDPCRRYTLRRYCEARKLPYQRVGAPVSLALFLEYADWFRAQAVGEGHDVKVTQLRRLAHGFAVQLADGTSFSSRRVILATGHMAFRVLPPELADLPEPQVLHSARIGALRNYAGREVCVVGAGQSALETAALLHESGACVRLLVRRDRIEWNPPSMPRPLLARTWRPDAGVATGWRSLAVSELPHLFRYFPPERRHRFVARSYGPSGSWWLRPRVERRVDTLLSSRVLSAAAANGGGVRLHVQRPGGADTLCAQHVVAATGFRVDVDRLEYLEPSLRRSIARESSSVPKLDAGFETSVPGLYIVGVASAPAFGPIMRFMYGAKHVAPVLIRQLRSAA
jgi:cation diffusion facilitator CzcD-associated flavoprotein CzcO